MFEKEAEKRCSEYFQENCYKENRWADTHDLVAMYLEGYNKANEWHKVADGDLPNNTDNVLSDNGVIIYYNFTHACWVDERASVEIDPPIAWREIPKFREKINVRKNNSH